MHQHFGREKVFPFCASPSLPYQVNTLPAKEIYSLHIDRNMQIFHWVPGKAIGMKQTGLEKSNHGQTSDSCLSSPFEKERIHLCFLQSCA